jgi:hypothetical protein
MDTITDIPARPAPDTEAALFRAVRNAHGARLDAARDVPDIAPLDRDSQRVWAVYYQRQADLAVKIAEAYEHAIRLLPGDSFVSYAAVHAASGWRREARDNADLAVRWSA